jgi:hypothetical protein
MRSYLSALLVAGLVLTFLFTGLPMGLGTHNAEACGWDQGGGQGYVPQRRDNGNSLAARPALTKEQARQVVDSHIHKLNSTLKVGRFDDAGELYEADIVSPDNEVVQVIGVDKRSGKLILLN